MRRSSASQAPRSTILQRSLQNGRYGKSGPHSIRREQVGHWTVAMAGAGSSQVQQVSSKAMSPSACFGLSVGPSQETKRTLLR